MDFVPVNEPLLNGNEEKYLIECIRTGWISSEGPFVARFEEAFAQRVARSFGVAMCNGSAALDAAVAAMGIGPGDEVLLPTFTIISCASAVTRAGALPVLYDSDADSWNGDVSQIERKITARTKAIMVVHIYGLVVDMDAVMALGKRYNLRVIEDAAEAHGQTFNGRPCGSFGDVSVFSFYPNKHVTCGEGGMALTSDPAIAEQLRSLRNLCFNANRRFVHDELGWNLRMSNLNAAVGLAQLERLDTFIEIKREMGAWYTAQLSDLDALQLPLARVPGAMNDYWVYGVVLKDKVEFDAAEAMRRLAALGIGTRPFFWSIHEQPVYLRAGMFSGQSYPVAERLARRGFYLPSGLALSREQRLRVVDAVRSVFM